MKIVIAGSRDIHNYLLMEESMVLCGWTPTEIVSGGARGVDQLGERWAASMQIPLERFPADWNACGKKAGILRNVQMAQYCDAAVILWDGQSKGTYHMITEIVKLKKPLYLRTAINDWQRQAWKEER